MRTHVVHLYEKIGSVATNFTNFSESLFTLGSFPVIAMVTNNSLELPSRQTLIKQFNLKPFEIIQGHFDLFIKKSNSLDVYLKDIMFTDEIEIDLEEAIEEALRNKDYDELYDLIKEVREEHTDIFSISFIYEQKLYRMTKYAVAEVLGETNDIPNIIVQSPLSLIAGLKKFPSSNTH
ncbi:hypothetical protein WKH56_27560 [Priestia sp. SB1]|uniref:hypothetical protein n=1 Tax=Priestia sp. SB1 TaxID=3132359 RepID=UPI00317C8F74